MFFGAYLDALDDELLTLLTSISTDRPATAAFKAEEVNEGFQSHEGHLQAKVGKWDYIVRHSFS